MAHGRMTRLYLKFLILTAVGLLAPEGAAAQAAADSTAIRETALDYIEGWYTADAARMKSALHPELTKRIFLRDPANGRAWLDEMGASKLVAGTANGGGSKTPVEARRSEVTILDIFRNTASVRVDAKDWIDYLHLVKTDDRWLIVNVLWELRE